MSSAPVWSVAAGGPSAATRVGVARPMSILDAYVVDDGKPSDRPSQSGSNPRVEGPLRQAVVQLDRGVRLGVIWVVYRGDAKAVTFEPRKGVVADGRATTKVTFSRPGTYTLRGCADDGILLDSKDVTVMVK